MEIMRRVAGFKLIESDPERPEVQYRDKQGVHKVDLIAGHLNEAKIEVFREKGYTYILTWNLKMPYAGIEKYIGNIPKGNLFLHSREAIEDELGKDYCDISPTVMAMRLSRHLIDISEEAEGRRS
jgi:hypothetical protein